MRRKKPLLRKKISDSIIGEDQVRIVAQFFANASDDQTVEALKEFLEKQPEAVEFVASLGQELSEEARQSVMYLALVLWKIFDSAANGNFPAATPKEIEKVYEKLENFFWKFRNISDDNFLNAFQKRFPIQQPFVYEFIFSELLGQDEGESWSEDDLLLMFLILNALIMVFNKKYEEVDSKEGSHS